MPQSKLQFAARLARAGYRVSSFVYYRCGGACNTVCSVIVSVFFCSSTLRLRRVETGLFIVLLAVSNASAFWDHGTTTLRDPRTDTTPRQSFFRWQWVYATTMSWWFWWYDWNEIARRRRLNVVAGISIDLLPLSTAVLLNRRVLITSYNFLDPYINRQTELRIWALGRAGVHNTAYRYRVWSVTRLVPLSLNPEHCHGPRCTHQPRHDVSIIYSRDQIYIFDTPPQRFHYAYRSFVVPWKYYVYYDDVWMAGSGYEYMEHVHENYKIFYWSFEKKEIVDCSKYIPKAWGKFVCIQNRLKFSGVQNGGGLFVQRYVVGAGCFEIRYNQDRIYAFTDFRYYYTKIHYYAYLNHWYYEYAYPQWGITLGTFYDSAGNAPYIPAWQTRGGELYPLGK